MQTSILTLNLAVGHYAVRPGHIVYINDTALLLGPADATTDIRRDTDVQLRFFVDIADPMVEIQPGMLDMLQASNEMEAVVTGYTASFGGDLSVNALFDVPPLRIGHKDGLPIIQDGTNPTGCLPYKHPLEDSVVLVNRGDCTFLEKLVQAKLASAAGVLVLSDEETAINPTANADELVAAGELGDVAIVLLPKRAGQILTEMLESSERGTGQVKMVLDQHSEMENTGHVPQEKEEMAKDPHRILYLNGHALLNTRILV